MEEIITKQPLANFYAFRRFQSAAEAQAAGWPTQWDSDKPVKAWCDQGALNSPRMNVVYDALAVNEFGKPVSDPTTKRPYMGVGRDGLVLSKLEAATLNMPPPYTGVPVLPEVPVPLRPLSPTQYLDWGDTPLEGVVVRDTRAQDLRPTEYTVRDQKTLYAIAKAVGL